MSKNLDVVRVSIAGQEYALKTSANADYLNSVADYVNQKMDEIEKSSPDSQSQLRTAILVSMNITDELFSEQKKRRQLATRVEAKTIAIREYVEEQIHKTEDK
ncbi:MAG: cell division protein ZapA [FCB group bacterium]|nr:cell division protein ZapA [FCB group bacterium]